MDPTATAHAARETSTSLTTWSLIAAVAIVAAGCGGGIPITEENVFQGRASITPATFERADVRLEETFFGGDPAIHGWYFDREQSRCTTLFFGGQGFHMVLARRRVEAFLDRVPVDLFMFDYRGYGRSGGTPTVASLKVDALDAYDHLTEDLGAECVVAHGHSIGTFLATWLADERAVDALVLEAPIVDADRFEKELIPWYLRLFVGFDIAPPLQREDNAERIADIDVPTLLIAGERDDVSPPSHAETLRERAAGEPTDLVIFEQGTHNDLYLQEDFASHYRALLRAAERDGAVSAD